MGKQWKKWQTLFSWAPKSPQMVTAVMKLKDTCSLEENGNLDSILKSTDTTLLTKVHLVKVMVFPVVMLDYKESWVLKNLCFRTVVLEETLECPLACKEIKPVGPKGYQSWASTGRTDVEAEIPILWSPDVNSWLTGKNADAGKDWKWEEKGMTEDEMVGCITDSMDMTLSKLGSWWWTGKHGVLQSMGSQTVGHNWVTELNWK